RGFDEPTVVQKAGLEYISLPIVHGAVTVDTMKRMHDTLRKLSGKKALLHCSSGNRTAAALIPYLIKEEGMQEEKAVDLAMRSGFQYARMAGSPRSGWPNGVSRNTASSLKTEAIVSMSPRSHPWPNRSINAR